MVRNRKKRKTKQRRTKERRRRARKKWPKIKRVENVSINSITKKAKTGI